MLHLPNACVRRANFGAVLALIFCAATDLRAQNWTTSGDFLIIDYPDRVTVRGTINTPSGVLQIPASINGKPVTAISDGAFNYSPALTGVVFPTTLTEIGRSSFQGCTALQSVTVPAGVVAISDYAFAGCSSLSSVSLPASLSVIGQGAFRDCDNIASVTIPQGVTIVGNGAFQDCTLLKTVIFPASLRTIGEYAFGDCSSLEAVNLPEGVNSIGRHAFDGCSALTRVTLPSTLTNLGPYAFYQCRSLAEVAVPAVAGIGDYTFAYCDALARVTIAPGVASIGEYAFFDSPSLTSISIPGSVTAIGKYAFYECRGLVTATLAGGITRIPEGLFQNCSSLTTANIPEGVTSIGSYAFQDCSLLASISMPSSVTSLGSAVFRNCSGLSSVVLSTALTSIPPNAFQSCSNLASVSIPAGVTTIGEWAFSGCRGLTEAVIPATVLSIGQWAFAYANLGKIELPDSVTSIGQHAFYECSSAQSLRLPSGLAGVANYAFGGCRSLSSITFPASLQSIGQGAFQDTAVSSLALPPGLITIGAYAFQNADNLQSVSFPKSVTSIGANAFFSCDALGRAEFFGNAPSLGSSAFAWAAQNFAVYYQSTASGFSLPTWQGYPSFVAAATLAVNGSLTSFNSAPGVASAAQNFTVSGNSLAASVTVSAPTGFEIAVGGGSYGPSVTLTPAGGSLTATTIAVRLAAGVPVGSVSGSIVVASTGATTRNLAVSGTVIGVPALEISGTLSGFETVSGIPSQAQTFTISGTSLNSVVTVSAPASFELSVGGGAYGSSATLSPAGGRLVSSVVSLRLSAAAPVGTVSGAVVVTSTGATARELPASGTVAAAPIPSINVVGALGLFSSTAGTASEAQSFMVEGINLTSDVTISAPPGFELSMNGGDYSPSVKLSPTDGRLAAAEISVRLSDTAPLGDLAGSVTLVSSGATPRSLAVGGKVDSAAPPPGIFIGNFSASPDRLKNPGDGVDVLGQVVLNSSESGFSMVAIFEGRRVRTKGAMNPAGPTSVFINTPRSKKTRRIEFSYVPVQQIVSVTLHEANRDEALTSFACYPVAYGENSPSPLARRRLNSLLLWQDFVGVDALGHGFLAATIKSEGLLVFFGYLPDNSKVTGSTRLVVGSDERVMAQFSQPLPLMRGLLWGNAVLDISAGEDDASFVSNPEMPLVWDRPPNEISKFFPRGLLASADLRGRLWQGGNGLNALTANSATTDFRVTVGGNGGAQWTGSWGPSNQPAWASVLPPKTAWKVNAATGVLNGRLPWASDGPPVVLRGLLLAPGLDLEGGSVMFGGGFSYRRGNSVTIEVTK